MKELLILVTITVVSFFLNSFSNVRSHSDGVVVIINNENPVSTLSAHEARLYFLRTLKSQWPGTNEDIRPVTRKTKCAERDAFYSQIVKMSDAEVESYFKRQFEHAEKTHDKVKSDKEAIEFVQRQPGGIGFISPKSLTADVRARVRVVLEL